MNVIIGNGPLGAATARHLVDDGQPVAIVSRSAVTDPTSGVEYRRVDANDVDRLVETCHDASVVYSCASPPYHRWAQEFPHLASSILTAAERAGAVLVIASNLYGYGAVSGPLTEDLPLAATGPKGRTRAAIWQQALSAHEAGRVRVTEARASDFFGPGVTTAGQLGSRVVPRILAGKSVSVLGDPDLDHSWTAIDDFAAALVRLGSDPRALGRPWHVPSTTATQRAMIDRMAALAKVPVVNVKSTPWGMLKAFSLVMPALRGLDEIRPQFDAPFVVDASAYMTTFGVQATPLDQALAATVNWWRSGQPG